MRLRLTKKERQLLNKVAKEIETPNSEHYYSCCALEHFFIFEAPVFNHPRARRIVRQYQKFWGLGDGYGATADYVFKFYAEDDERRKTRANCLRIFGLVYSL